MAQDAAERHEAELELESAARQRCYGCFRPKSLCFCDYIPSIENQLELLIIQHRRERFHPFNTARIVNRALKRSQLLVDRVAKLAARELPIKPGAALLYPGPQAKLITELSPEEIPSQIVLLDGTWHHAKQLYRELPAVQALPQIMLHPESPGNYRIRKEPSDIALATIEASVEMLRVLEPNLEGLDRLIAAFNKMIDDQIAHPKERTPRYNKKRHRTPLNIPLSVIKDLDNVVVMYGESWADQTRARGIDELRYPIYWVAQRIGSGELFSCAIRWPDQNPSFEKIREHYQLDEGHFLDAVAPEEFVARWNDFLKPADVLASYHYSTEVLLRRTGVSDEHKILNLKTADLKRKGTLAEIIEAEQVECPEPELAGRPGKRLAYAVGFARHLNKLGNAEN